MANKTLTIRILTPEGTLHEGTAGAVFLPGVVSPFEVLPDHAPIISALDKGEIRVVDGGKEQRFPIRSGVAKVRDNEIIACVETA